MTAPLTTAARRRRRRAMVTVLLVIPAVVTAGVWRIVRRVAGRDGISPIQVDKVGTHD
jgi:hypothetical protein